MWESCVITKNGAELLGRLSGAELTGAKFGLSTVPEASLALQTEVTAPNGNLGIEGFKLIEGGFSATVRITNKGVEEEYTVKQIGIYAREKNGTENILLAVTQDKIGNRIPSETEMPDFSLQFTIIVGVSNEAEITAIVDSSVFVSREQVEIIVRTEVEPLKEEIGEHIKDGGKHITAEERIKWNGKADKNNLDAHINNKSNPHAVTKAQVGLGNVPNVATNDQTPTYTAASVLSELSSGEKLSVSFGRLAKAVKDLITHIADNVRHVTAAERSAWNGKAASNHSHPAASASAAGLMSAADKSKLNEIKVSGINATYGKETISKATTGPISKTVTISHKTDIVFLWVLNYAAYGTVIVLNSYANSEMLAGSFTVRLSQSTNSAALEFTGGSNLDETVYYAAFRMS